MRVDYSHEDARQSVINAVGKGDGAPKREWLSTRSFLTYNMYTTYSSTNGTWKMKAIVLGHVEKGCSPSVEGRVGMGGLGAGHGLLGITPVDVQGKYACLAILSVLRPGGTVCGSAKQAPTGVVSSKNVGVKACLSNVYHKVSNGRTWGDQDAGGG